MTLVFGDNLFDLDFISGISIGLEVFIGDDAAPEDLFAITVDLLIFRFTYVRRR